MNEPSLVTYEALQITENERYEKSRDEVLLEKINTNSEIKKLLVGEENISQSLTINDALEIIDNKISPKELFREYKFDTEKGVMGEIRIQHIESKKIKNYYTDDFIDWAAAYTKANKFKLQNENLNLIIDGKYKLSEVKNIGKIKDLEFNQILDIVTYNAHADALVTYDHLLELIVDEYEKIRDKKKQNDTDAKKIIELRDKAGKIFKSINELLQSFIDSVSFYFYFNVDPNQLAKIFQKAKKLEDSENKISFVQPFVSTLIEYYVLFIQKYTNDSGIGNLSKQSKLNSIFDIVFDATTDEHLKRKIIDSYTIDNPYLPYLPFDIIKRTKSNSDPAIQKKIIGYLKERYSMDGSEKDDIESLNEDYIRDSSDCYVKKYAFDWLYEVIAPERKEDWCKKIYTILQSQNLGENPAYQEIREKCLNVLSEDKVSDIRKKAEFILSQQNEDLKGLYEVTKEYFDRTKSSDAMDEISFKNGCVDRLAELYHSGSGSTQIEILSYFQSVLKNESENLQIKGKVRTALVKIFGETLNSNLYDIKKKIEIIDIYLNLYYADENSMKDFKDFSVKVAHFLWENKADIEPSSLKNIFKRVKENQDIELMDEIISLSWFN